MRTEQPLWSLHINVDSFVKQPEESLKVALTVRNLSDSALYFSKAEVLPSWAEGKRGIKSIDRNDYIVSGDATFLTEFDLIVPSQPGLYTLKFGLETWIYNYIQQIGKTQVYCRQMIGVIFKLPPTLPIKLLLATAAERKMFQ